MRMQFLQSTNKVISRVCDQSEENKKKKSINEYKVREEKMIKILMQTSNSKNIKYKWAFITFISLAMKIGSCKMKYKKWLKWKTEKMIENINEIISSNPYIRRLK